jgi:hypothetical protein
MVSNAAFRKLALSFKEAVELPHFDKASFRAPKIFATLDETKSRACLMLTEADQAMYCSFDETIIYPVPNKWGKHGATLVELKKVTMELLKAVMEAAYAKATIEKSTSKPSKSKR